MLSSNGIMLKKHKLSVTPIRLEILKWVVNHKRPFSLNDLKGLSADPSTLYRNLEKLVEKGILRKEKAFGGMGCYELLDNEDLCEQHHHHITCSVCQKVTCIDVCEIGELFARKAKEVGHQYLTHRLEIRGRCKDCE